MPSVPSIAPQQRVPDKGEIIHIGVPPRENRALDKWALGHPTLADWSSAWPVIPRWDLLGVPLKPEKNIFAARHFLELRRHRLCGSSELYGFPPLGEASI